MKESWIELNLIIRMKFKKKRTKNVFSEEKIRKTGVLFMSNGILY